jgi:Fe-S cluster assembly protein SufD
MNLLGEVESLRDRRMDGPSFVGDLRGSAAERFCELGFPTPRSEQWRFTNVKRIAQTPYVVADGGTSTPSIERWALPGAHLLVMVDGAFVPELSAVEALPPGTVLASLAEVLDRSPELVEPHLGAHARVNGHAFTALNTALFRDGAFLWLPTGAQIRRPIQLLNVTSASPEPRAVLPRNLIVAGGSSSATVVETYAGLEGPSLTCPVTEIAVGANASLDHHVTHQESDDASHVGVRHVTVERDATFSSHSICLDGELVRNDVSARLDGEGGHVSLNGLYLTDGSRHVDNQLRVHHATPHCTSEQLYKGILDGSSKAVFNGRIVVDPGAQKTNAEQSNRNLLLSDRALVHSNPQLEIFADDVRCTHGSTVGRLDEDALFYLRARGIDKAAAEGLLTYAFAADVIHRIGLAEIRERLLDSLGDRLPGGGVVREAV